MEMMELVGCSYCKEERNSAGKWRRVLFFQVSEEYGTEVVRTKIPKPEQEIRNHEVEKVVKGEKREKIMQIWEKLQS